MDYHQQVLALAAAQSVHDAMEAPEYYEDDDIDEEWLARQHEDSEDEQEVARRGEHSS